ncbi:hypothetical protein [Aquimarina pacifica]|uniref:hypothetical protein n=1 Tax=Aquimarina pacifica TaxID=1296415 RepID=UPI0004AD2E6D|nr:hypothetical protein [Aquimarina pacifica]
MKLTIKATAIKDIKKCFLLLFAVFLLQNVHSQDKDFWSKVRFGGGIGLGFSNDSFTGYIAPSAIYEFNNWFNAGVGLHFGYSSFSNDNIGTQSESESTNYGGSLIMLANASQALQFSAEFEEMFVNRSVTIENQTIKDTYWYPALFLGVAYRVGKISAGVKYDILYDTDTSIYGSAYIPFVRVFL